MSERRGSGGWPAAGHDLNARPHGAEAGADANMEQRSASGQAGEHVSLPYRAEVDGLRALAVLPVIFFHAGFKGFSGGYLGVDIFFVISGYLITSIIDSDLARNRYSLLGFYERRARRILPALFLVAVASAVAAWQLMIPEQLEEFGQSLVSLAFFVSNYLFYSQTSYFGTATELKPLLHTWSLAVEEQFYVIYPLLLVLVLVRLRHGAAQVAMLALLVVLVVVAELATRHNPDLAFYSIHSRGFELLMGALAARSQSTLLKLTPSYQAAAAWAAAVVTVLCLAAFGRSSHHPGLATLVPVTAAAALLVYASPRNVLGRAFALAPVVLVGKMSYSLYLWHQPVFAFYRLYEARDLRPREFIAPIVACFIVAYVSWRFVEQPFRRRGTVPRGALAAFVGAFAAIQIGVGGLLVANEGYPQRSGTEARRILAAISAGGAARDKGIRLSQCHFNPRYAAFEAFMAHWDCLPAAKDGKPAVKLLVYGDSHAADKAWALRSADIAVGNMGGAGCPLVEEARTASCNAMARRVRDMAREGKVSGLILAQRWSDDEITPQALGRLAQFWREAGVPILLFTPMPEFASFKEQVMRRALIGEALTTIGYDESRLRSVEAQLRRHLDAPPFTLIDTRALFCGSGGTCSAFEGDKPLLLDYGHFSPRGAEEFGRRVAHDGQWTRWLATLKPVN